MNIAYNVDCMEYMRTLQDKAFDLAVADPPYFSGPERRGYYGRDVYHAWMEDGVLPGQMVLEEMEKEIL